MMMGNTTEAVRFNVDTQAVKGVFSDLESNIPQVTYDKDSRRLSIQNSHPLLETHDIIAIELILTYWPDKHNDLNRAELIVREDKMYPARELQ